MSTRDPRRLTRRDALAYVGASAAAAAVTLPGAAAAARKPATAHAPVRFDDPIWNRETVARLEADVAPGKFVNGYVTGTVHGVRDGEAVKPLFGFEVYSATRVLRQPDQSYQRLCRELIFYRDLQTGALLEEWDNPYTGERVKVVDVANDPFNYVISEWFPQPPSYGGLNADKRPPRRPLVLKWATMGPNTVTLERDIHLYYRNALDPAKWPRESGGPMNRVSELFRYVIRREDIENPELTHLPYTGIWSRVTPWLPWMLMGPAPGQIMYMGMFSSVNGFEGVPANVAERVRTKYPQYQVAPEKWVDPSLSSLENYARTQTPAPPRPTQP